VGRLAGTLELKSPPERVWEVLRDADLRPRWEVGVVRVEDVTGPLDQEGTTWTEVRALAGVTMRERWRVVQVEPLRSLELAGTSPGGGRITIREHVEPASEGGTVKRFEAEYKLPGGPLGTLLERVFMQRKLERDSLVADERFRALAE
jgi:uncharacterized protein YndB with AHSA1/START domain